MPLNACSYTPHGAPVPAPTVGGYCRLHVAGRSAVASACLRHGEAECEQMGSGTVCPVACDPGHELTEPLACRLPEWVTLVHPH